MDSHFLKRSKKRNAKVIIKELEQKSIKITVKQAVKKQLSKIENSVYCKYVKTSILL
jgi:hypothetical protein